MRLALANSIRISLVVLLAFLVVPSSYAQKEQAGALETQMADAIAHSKSKGVLVFDFAGTDPRLGPLGAVLADNFSSGLAASGGKFHVADRSRLKEMMDDNGLDSSNLVDPDIASWLAGEQGAQVLVLGTLERDAENVSLSVSLYGVKDGKRVATFATTIPLTDEMKSLIPETVQREYSKQLRPAKGGQCISNGSPPCGGENGFSVPKCISCPKPDYSKEALDRRVEGFVILAVIVDENGKMKDIRVVKALPYGLSRQAILTAEKWTLQPATGPDGKPAAVRQFVEMVFRLG